MKKQILFTVLLFFSAVHGMDEPEKGKLLFPFPEKSATDVWQMVRETYIAHHYFLESDLFMSLPGEIRQRIFRLWFMVHNPPSFSTPEDQFFRKLLGCCITLNCKKEEWPRASDDIECLWRENEDYSVFFKENAVDLAFYDKKKQSVTEELKRQQFSDLEILFQRNMIIYHEQEDIHRACYIYDIIQKQRYFLWESYLNIKAISPSENYVVILDRGETYLLDITDINKVVAHKLEECLTSIYGFYDSSVAVAFSSDEEFFAYSTKSHIVLMSLKNNALGELCLCEKSSPSDSNIKFTSNNECLIVGCIADKYQFIDGMKVNRTDRGSVVLEKIFTMSGFPLGVTKEGTFTITDNNEFKIMDCSGKVLGDLGRIRSTSQVSFDGKHIEISLLDSNGESRGRTITHLLHDDQGRYVGFQQKISEDPGYLAKFDPSARFMIRRDTFNDHDIVHCKHLDETVIASLKIVDKNGQWFSNDGRYVCYNIGRYELYPKGADDHFKELAHKPLTRAHYASLEKVCSEVEKLRNALEQENKKPELS
jgi:hypothetical protein